MKRLFIAAAVFGLLTTQALSTDRQTLSGFQKFRFGMSEQQIRKITTIEEASQIEEGLWLGAAQSIEIDGVRYRLRFLLNRDKLSRIRLSDETVASDTDCGFRFNRIFALVQAKYGNPDQPPKRSVFPGGIAVLQTATFTFRDGGRIISSAYYQEGKCTALISYVGVGPGASF